jgi:hypothetical protein
MFSLILSFLIYLYQINFSGHPWQESLAISAKFLFIWNLFFAGLTFLFFFALLLGLSAILFRLPFVGVGMYRFHEKIREAGIVNYLGRTASYWMISRFFILFGSYFLAFESPIASDLSMAGLAIIFAGYFLKKIGRSRSRVKSQFSIHTYQNTKSNEKDVSPDKQNNVGKDPLIIDQNK